MMPTRTLDSYHFGNSKEFTDKQLRNLITVFNRPKNRDSSVLSGRCSVTHHQIEGIGKVVVKHYRRGGLIQYFIRQKYLRLGKTRGQMEYEYLQKVRKIGINAPEPIVYAYQGSLFYRGWLITREIQQPVSLVQLSYSNEKRIQQVMQSVINQIYILIQHKIAHVDLHPGNVVVDIKDRVFLVDFDKASVFKGNITKLRFRYLNRWKRAVSKHHLPVILNELMFSGLNQKFEK